MEELCDIEAILIKIKSAKNPGYLHGLNDTPYRSMDPSKTWFLERVIFMI
jgi:hypothetical protein